MKTYGYCHISRKTQSIDRQIRKADSAKKMIRRYSRDLKGLLSDTECMRLIRIARNTFYKYKREIVDSLPENIQK